VKKRKCHVKAEGERKEGNKNEGKNSQLSHHFFNHLFKSSAQS
jgi:hypothetical protein